MSVPPPYGSDPSYPPPGQDPSYPPPAQGASYPPPHDSDPSYPPQYGADPSLPPPVNPYGAAPPQGQYGAPPPYGAYQPPYAAGPPQYPGGFFGVDAWGRPLSDKSKLVAGLLQLFLGTFGIGRFYLGYTGIGVAQLAVSILTCGIGAIWPFIDGIMILVGKVPDSEGRTLRE
jgi:TM2 domain-containing membrane protein YozV